MNLKPTGSWASCGREKLSTVRSRKVKVEPVLKIFHCGLFFSLGCRALAVIIFAKTTGLCFLAKVEIPAV